MNDAGIYHRPESEYAFLYSKNVMRIRLQTARNEIKTVGLISGDFTLLLKKNGIKRISQWLKRIRQLHMIIGKSK